MSDGDMQPLEQRLRRAAATLAYPPTPPVAAHVMARIRRRTRPARRVWVAIAAVILLLGLILVTPARAAVIEFIRIGVVRIFPAPPAPAPISTPAVQAPVTATPVASAASPITPPLTDPLAIRDLAGQTTLAAAQRDVGFPLLLPSEPPSIGTPDRVYVQTLGSPLVLLVWLDPADSRRVQMSLAEIPPGSWAIDKFQPRVLKHTAVRGNEAIWAEGPYMVEIRNGNYESRQIVEGNALIWTQGKITYRLETNLPLDEALKIAESLKPLP